MTLLVLSARPDLETNRRLQEAAEGLGIDLRVVDATRTHAVAGSRPGLWLEAADLLAPQPRAVLARVGNWRPESVLAALEASCDLGVPTPNPAAAIRVGRDHWHTARCLASAGLPVPDTVAGADPEALAAAARERLELPVVVKQRRSRMGVGVMLCESWDHLEAVLDSLWRVGDELVVQRYIRSDGTSLRLLVAGGRVVAAARFGAAQGEWRSNAARGGRADPHRPRAEEIELALAAARVTGLGVSGVDLLRGRSRVVVGEVNPTPGFRRLEEVTGADVARSIVEQMVACRPG